MEVAAGVEAAAAAAVQHLTAPPEMCIHEFMNAHVVKATGGLPALVLELGRR